MLPSPLPPASGAVALRARYVLPVEGQPLENGVVTFVGDQIVAVGPGGSGPPPLDLGNVALLPGLVNAHTHLEFSDLAAPLGTAGNRLCDWIGAVVQHRETRATSRVAAISQGLAECVRTGTTTLGEIATPPWPPESFASERLPGCDVTFFLELLGLPQVRASGLKQLANAFLLGGWRTGDPQSGWQLGLSPHAPYSVHQIIVDSVSRDAAAGTHPVAMHIAESREELELLERGTGPFAELLHRRGAWDDGAFRLGTRPLDYLRLLSQARRSLVVHGNYLAEDEFKFLADHRDRMTLIYCPRTHAYFRHERYPLEVARRLGVRIAIGTDSRASNPDLNLLEELRLMARLFPSVPASDLVRMGTLDGAEALGRANEAGSLVVGKLANLVAVALPEDDRGDPSELLLHSSGQVVRVWHRGQRVW